MRLSFLLLLITVLACGTLLVVYELQVSETFERNAQSLSGISVGELRDLGETSKEMTREVVTGSVFHVTDLYNYRIMGLPLELYQGNPDALAAELQSEAEELRGVTRRNTGIILDETSRRLERRIDRSTEKLENLLAEQQESYLESYRSLAMIFVSIIGGLIFVLSCACLYLFVVRPLQRLRHGTEEIARGGYGHLVEVSGADEISSLALSFNKMSAELKDYARARDDAEKALIAKNAEIEQLNSMLEEKVIERTRELRSTVARLETTLGELQSAQTQLIESEKMASLGRIAGGVAHEFGNLLAGISGCVEVMFYANSEDDRISSMDRVKRCVEKGRDIVDSLLRFARKNPVRKSGFDVVRVIDDCIVLAKKEAEKRGIRVVRIGANGLSAFADENQLGQVVLNLVTNAIHASPAGAVVKVDACVREEGLVIEVSDEGSGISENDLPHVFEPFFTTKLGGGDSPRGTGLGLAVSLGIVKNHGGTIDIRSAPGEGSTFAIMIPQTAE
ncbi:MAG: ATP-binding protein [Planctomycetes bacterium]|nr:ATP-binding protein [Planctomycetota bacterium]